MQTCEPIDNYLDQQDRQYGDDQMPSSQKLWREANELWLEADRLTDEAIEKLRAEQVTEEEYYALMLASAKTQYEAAELDKAAGFVWEVEGLQKMREVN